jgi:RNA polymerase sigma-70 factor, ECF subfamily
VIGSELTDLNALMAQLADGDRAAFTPVFRTLWPKVYRLCQHLLQSSADAEDAAQQAMEKILSRASEYDAKRPALPWALGIAGWECRTLRQRKTRRRELSDESAPDPQDASLSADDALAERDLIAGAMTALGTLSPNDQETLLATYFDGASSANGPTLRKRRERALDRLRVAFRRLYAID